MKKYDYKNLPTICRKIPFLKIDTRNDTKFYEWYKIMKIFESFAKSEQSFSARKNDEVLQNIKSNSLKICFWTSPFTWLIFEKNSP